MPTAIQAAFAIVLLATVGEARVVQLRIERRETVLNGKQFGLAGAYEKLYGKVEFVLDPCRTPERRNRRSQACAAQRKWWSGIHCRLLPSETGRCVRGNGRILYEVGNRGTRAMLRTFQKACPNPDPTSEDEIGDGALMAQGYALLWMGWKWDVPEGLMRMDIPIATDHGAPIMGLVRGNFVLNTRSATGVSRRSPPQPCLLGALPRRKLGGKPVGMNCMAVARMPTVGTR